MNTRAKTRLDWLRSIVDGLQLSAVEQSTVWERCDPGTASFERRVELRQAALAARQEAERASGELREAESWFAGVEAGIVSPEQAEMALESCMEGFHLC